MFSSYMLRTWLCCPNDSGTLLIIVYVLNTNIMMLKDRDILDDIFFLDLSTECIYSEFAPRGILSGTLAQTKLTKSVNNKMLLTSIRWFNRYDFSFFIYTHQKDTRTHVRTHVKNNDNDVVTDIAMRLCIFLIHTINKLVAFLSKSAIDVRKSLFS